MSIGTAWDEPDQKRMEASCEHSPAPLGFRIRRQHQKLQAVPFLHPGASSILSVVSVPDSKSQTRIRGKGLQSFSRF
ncbi:hypothetical protein HNY73_011872 [Argiope bruennichi]|uniref:Uncharacterized protein n=1 Tax=Argiope bruennichi TaxID=94029 RepID=A0A8T0ETC7_ARGBR|nr:hypothetical protein HNY73_011872 [Argiope bruennichi]